MVRRLDHVAVVVRDTERALAQLRDRIGVEVSSSEELSDPAVRLTYVDVGNCYLQLVEPTNPTSEVAQWLDMNGEGMHHICFGVDDVAQAISVISGAEPSPALGSGRGRSSGFVPGTLLGVRIECTEFSHREDVELAPGWLPG